MTRCLSCAVLALALACGGGTGHGTSTSYEQTYDKFCVIPPADLTGKKGVGDVCSTYFDCMAYCCYCDSSYASYTAASCVAGKCADITTTCNNAELMLPMSTCTVP